MVESGHTVIEKEETLDLSALHRERHALPSGYRLEESPSAQDLRQPWKALAILETEGKMKVQEGERGEVLIGNLPLRRSVQADSV